MSGQESGAGNPRRRRPKKGKNRGPHFDQPEEDMSGYYFIKSGLNGLVLDVKDGSTNPGTPVVTWTQKPRDNDTQLFYDDRATGTIRSKGSNLCLDVQGNTLVINHYYAGNQSQQWAWDGAYIHNRFNRNQVLDIQGSNSRRGATVCSYQRNGQDNQSWSKYQPLDGYFFIRSSLNGLVLDVPGGSGVPGSAVLTWFQKADDYDSQLFKEDSGSGTIRCKNSQFCLDLQGDNVVVSPYYEGNQSQKWKFEGTYICNKHKRNKVLCIIGSNRNHGASVGSCNNRTGQLNQSWVKCMVLPDAPGCSPVPAAQSMPTYKAQLAFPTSPSYPTPSVYSAYPDPPVYTPTVYPTPVVPKFFYLKSKMNNLVLDAEGEGTTPGTRLIMWPQKYGGKASNQLFYEDQKSGTIKSKASNLCFQSQGNEVTLQTARPGELSQQWMLSGDQVVMRTNANTVLDIMKKNRLPGAKVGAWPNNNGNNQKWNIEYV